MSYWGDKSAKVLLDKTFESIRWMPGSTNLIIRASGNEIVLEPEGDCCSYTWIDRYSGAGGGRIISVNTDKKPDQPPSTKSQWDCLSEYRWEIVTEQGTITIDFFNDSNGYYGGWINCREYHIAPTMTAKETA